MRYLLVLLCIVSTFSAALADQDGGRAGSFLSYGGSARDVALGGNPCAATDGAGALLWNPAGLALAQTRLASLSHALIDEDRSRNFLAYVMPLERISLGAGWLNAGTGGVQNRGLDGTLLDESNDSENLLMLGVATHVHRTRDLDLMLGATFRHFRHTLFDNAGTGSGLDLGATGRLPGWRRIRTVTVAASVHNLGADISWDTDTDHSDTVPATFHAGIALQLIPFDALITGSLTRPEAMDTRTHLGVEVPIQAMILRVGLDHGDPAAGFGLPIKTGQYEMILNYGYRNDDITDTMLHFFSFGFRH